MRKVLFAKFSRERSPAFQIVTKICAEDGKRAVYKEALTQEAEAHIGRMLKSAGILERSYQYPGLKVCLCERLDARTVRFQFHEGENLDQKVTRQVQVGDLAGIRQNVERLYGILASQAGLQPFEPTETFREVFGDIALPPGQMAAPVSNLDMLFANLLEGDSGLVLVDYEWVFDFPVPISFIFARSLILHGMLQTLPKEQQEELYAIGGVKPEDVPVYYEMEVRFQRYVTGQEELSVLSKLYPRMKTSCFFLDYWNTQHVCYAVRVLGVPKDTPEDAEELFFSLRFQGEVRERVEISDTERYQAFLFEPADTECILRMYYFRGRNGERDEEVAFSTHNAQLCYVTDYYFRQPPVMRIENRGYQELSFGYIVCHRNDPLIAHEIDLRMELHKYTDKPYRKALRRLKRMVQGVSGNQETES